MLSRIEFQNVLEIGCGEGVLLYNLRERFGGKDVVGIDIGSADIETAKRNVPFVSFAVGDLYALPFSNGQFDLVLCCEVLEHLQKPEKALSEIKRVSGRYAIFSVPNEPLWRLAHIRELGNTPGHINHWNEKSFVRLVSIYFQITDTVAPPPWIALLVRKTDEKRTGGPTPTKPLALRSTEQYF